jgi:hypothetical protein
MMTLRVLDELTRFQFHLQQLGRAPNAAQRVLDLVREVADEFLVGLGLVDQPLFALLARLLLQWQQFHDHFAWVVGLCHHHMHRQGVVVQALEPGVVAQRGKLVATGALQGVFQQGRLGEAVLQQGARDAAAGHA